CPHPSAPFSVAAPPPPAPPALALHAALPIAIRASGRAPVASIAASSPSSSAAAPSLSGDELPAVTVPSVRNTGVRRASASMEVRSEEHTSELQSRENLVCRVLLEKKNEIDQP